MIAVAVQQGSSVYVYDEKGSLLLTAPGDLVGYTSGSVSVKNGDYVFTYDEHSRLIFTHSV